ncbi:hypothetical protein HF524_05370 [Proteus mirabilis]|jgi:hypothetical protein|uniref:Phage protein n=7 Tax=Morganellaceae TaxID=1903414 RepID=A0AAN1EWA3_PROMI|nr:hypothetical protein AOUC001_13325 [Proteus mirabilis]NBM28883.1 hypothetical protein [Proteus sp. G4417]NBM84366.1 hypothetical protein [Proteus sp. G4404]NBN16060.1 hypothetical protein [Proteus sp. G4398]NBN20068.1 hypothetical protein [Proteus sp. G4400]NBN83709.1 hypothetical protein [Proteus sp. G4378]OFV18400.1 hypothetical protein HMPREF3129_09430 [Proteus sp. HMSC14B05]CAR41214.1 phage protein [Proteus mirabilis HI4320]
MDMAKRPDWEAIESAYRAGVMSIREIASQYEITHQAISKRAKKEGWERDLKAKVKARAENLVAKREVASLVATEKAISERQLIEANAEVIANVRMEHRGDIRRARELTNNLFDELSAECADVPALRKLGELMFSPDDNGRDKLNEIYHSIISLPERVKSAKSLSETFKNLVGLERQAYGLDDVQPNKTASQLSELMDDLSKE